MHFLIQKILFPKVNSQVTKLLIISKYSQLIISKKFLTWLVFYNFNKTKDVPEKRPAYVFCIEASSQCLSLGIFSKVLDNISTFLENDIDEEIPFMICTYSDRVIFKVL